MVIVCNVNIFAKTYEENDNGGEKITGLFQLVMANKS